LSATADVPFDWKKLASATRIDKMSYSVKGLTPGEAVITFRKGDKRAVVKVTVVVGGLN
jgi:hypothetical protein